MIFSTVAASCVITVVKGKYYLEFPRVSLCLTASYFRLLGQFFCVDDRRYCEDHKQVSKQDTSDKDSPRYESRLVWVGVHHAGSIWRRTVSWSRDNLIIQHVSSAQNVRVRLLGNSLLLMMEGRTVCTLFSLPLK